MGPRRGARGVGCVITLSREGWVDGAPLRSYSPVDKRDKARCILASIWEQGRGTEGKGWQQAYCKRKELRLRVQARCGH